MHLHAHVPVLYNMIRHKALVQYCSPFLSVKLHNMAVAFNCAVGDIERDLIELILKQQLSAKIDHINKVHVADCHLTPSAHSTDRARAYMLILELFYVGAMDHCCR
jgi:hypothetical protein